MEWPHSFVQVTERRAGQPMNLPLFRRDRQLIALSRPRGKNDETTADVRSGADIEDSKFAAGHLTDTTALAAKQ